MGYAAASTSSVLVTGSTGFLGARLVQTLVERGYQVRAFARRTSRAERLRRLNVEIHYGDMMDVASLGAAFEGINLVVHAAADTNGVSAEGVRATIEGAQNIMALSKKHRIKKLVYISSCSVYGIVDLREGQMIDESTPLERHPERRGFYSEAKSASEKLLLESAGKNRIPFVCLRPGTIFGEGGETFTPMMGFSPCRRIFFLIGNGSSILPLVYIDNLIEAIVGALDSSLDSACAIYNVVDQDRISKREYVDLLLRRLHPEARFFYVPYSLLHVFVRLQEAVFAKITGKRPILTAYRLVSSQRSVVYDSSKLQREMNWSPRVSLRDGIARVLNYELKKSRGETCAAFSA